MTGGYSAEQTARLLSALRWSCGRLTEIVSSWASEAAAASLGGPLGADGDRVASCAVRLSVLARHLETHCAVLEALQPDSVLLAPYRMPAPADKALVEALDKIAACEDHSDRRQVAEAVFVAGLADVCESIIGHSAAHSDAALSAAARAMRDDLERGAKRDGAVGRGEGGAALHSAPASPVSDAVAGALGELRDAGGIVPRRLTVPGAFE